MSPFDLFLLCNMNYEYSKKTIIPELVAISCILIVSYFGILSLQITSDCRPISNTIQVWVKTWATQTGQQIARPERPITIITGAVKYSTTRNPKKDDNPKQKSISTNTGIITKVFIKDWSWTYQKVKAAVETEEITKHILYACTYSRNQPHCVNSILWIAKAESSLFHNCYMNSCLGIKPSSKVKTYPTIKYGIDDRVERYNKYRWNNHNAEDMLTRSLYCNWPCEDKWSNWRLSFDSFIWYIK